MSFWPFGDPVLKRCLLHRVFFFFVGKNGVCMDIDEVPILAYMIFVDL